jgi:hypothetical protein
MSDQSDAVNYGIDARTFQKPLAELTETLALKVQREGIKLINPSFVAVDIYVMVRQVLKIYELFFYLNADIRRSDPAWHIGYPAAILPLVRCMIDCLYNITTLLEDPVENGRHFRASGYRQILEAIAEDEKTYGGDPKWDAHNLERRKLADLDMHLNGFALDEVMKTRIWSTLGRYLSDAPETSNKTFLRRLTLGFWREYSGMAHAAFHGLIPTAGFFAPRDVPLELRSKFQDHADGMLSMHLLRVVGVLLCILTEIQGHFGFDGAHINERLHKVWDAVLPALEIKELYDQRYAELMRDRGINRNAS